jgi:hypothetical protein
LLGTRCLLGILLLLWPVVTMADSINGYVEYLYATVSTKTTDASGQSTKTDSNSFFQRYNFLFEKTIYPKLKLEAGGQFEKDLTKSKSEGTETTSTNSTLRPYATLTLQDPLYTASVGYYLREDTLNVSRTPNVTTTNEQYTGTFGWRPVGLPSLDLRYTRTDEHDQRRAFLDTTIDYLSLISHYANKGLDLWYYGTYTDTDNKLHGLETQDVNHNARGTYGDSFLDGRLNFTTSYNIIRDEITLDTTGPGAGTVSIQLFPFAGLFALNDTPAIGALSPDAALIDGNLTASAGINIGLPPFGGDTRARNMGLDLLNGTTVNNLLVWVDRELPADVAASFSWDIYTSPDNLNWTFLATVPSAPFGPFQNRFDIDFPSTSTRYIKVVVKPLQSTAINSSNFPDIFVTELQAFVKRPVQQTKEEKIVSTSQISNTTLRYSILNAPFLYYDFLYYYSKTGVSAQEQSTLSNGFSLNQQLSRVLTLTARAAREDGTEQNENRTAYIYNASLLGTPLKTLTSGLVFSGRDEHIGGKPRNSNSVFLNNTTQLYKGVALNFNGGYTFSTELDDSKLKTTILTLGANIVPRPTLTTTVYLTYIDSHRTTPGLPETTNLTNNATITVAYNPVRALYLLASVQFIDETGQRVKTLQNYGLNWSPFPDGALQFRFSYNEERRTQDQFTNKIINPGLRYKINTRSYLDLSYQSIRSDSPSQKTDTDIFSANLKIFF